MELKKQCKYNNLQKPNIKPCACADYVVWILQCFFPFVVFAFAFFVAFVCKSIVDLSMHSSTIGALYRMHCTSYGKLKPFYNKINMCEINAFSNTHTFPYHSLYYSSSVCYEYSNRRAKKNREYLIDFAMHRFVFGLLFLVEEFHCLLRVQR